MLKSVQDYERLIRLGSCLELAETIKELDALLNCELEGSGESESLSDNWIALYKQYLKAKEAIKLKHDWVTYHYIDDTIYPAEQTSTTFCDTCGETQ